jgi:hypothetical protein
MRHRGSEKALNTEATEITEADKCFNPNDNSGTENAALHLTAVTAVTVVLKSLPGLLNDGGVLMIHPCDQSNTV